MKIKLPDFTDNKDAIAYLVKNKQELIDLKKSVNKKTDAFSVIGIGEPVTKLLTATANTDTDTSIERTIVGGAYNWMDSHDDVHIEGVFAKSIKERVGKIWHLHDHLFEITAKVGRPKNVYESFIAWIELGVNKAGQTQALFMDSNILKELNPTIFMDYKAGEIQQHSVAMSYVKIILAANDPNYAEEYDAWNKYFPLLGNPQRALDKGYFWPVLEAKLIEISCVLEGSNELTPTMPVGSKEVKEVKTDTETQPPLGTEDQPLPKSFEIKQLFQIF